MAFAIAGAIVYQVTAPPPAPGERSFSPGRILDNIRREIRGNRASAETVTAGTYPVDGTITDLQVSWPAGSAAELTIVGEDRPDIASELKVHSAGYDDAEAQQTAKATVLKIERAGMRLAATIDFPKEGRQTASLTLRVPARLQLKVAPARARTLVSNVAAVDIDSGRGETEIKQIKGRTAGAYRGGELRVTGAASVKFTTIGTDVRIEQITGETSMNMRAGNLKATELGGPIELDTTGVDVELEKLEKTNGMVRITASAGSVSLKGLRTEARIDARSSDVEATLERAVALSIFSDGGSPVEVTEPPGGYLLDAIASDGDITVPEGTVQVAVNGQEHRAVGPVKGGGPTITIRTSHAGIRVRARETTEGNAGNGERR